MGKQVLFHMTAEDRHNFCIYARDVGLELGRRDGDSRAALPLTCESFDDEGTFCFWSKKLCPDLKRTWISDPGYYRVDSLRLSVLEYMPSVAAEWEGRPALCQGRLFGNFEAGLGKPIQFLQSYQALVAWIKKNYRKNSFGLGGYIGPSAWDFHTQGGNLLPLFVPATTREWIDSINAQHLPSHNDVSNRV